MEKQKLLFHQSRLASRGVYEMVLQFISACKGSQSDMVMHTLELGISILRGGNLDIQMVISYSKHLTFEQMNELTLDHLDVANAQLLEREERRRLLRFHRWIDELVQRAGLGRFRA